MNHYNFKKHMGRELGEALTVQALQNLLAKYDYHGLIIELNGDKVKLEGRLLDQATLERIVLLLGNLRGIGEIDISAIHRKNNIVPSKVTRFYEVEQHNSLWNIAEKVYGVTHGDKYRVLYEANRPMLKAPDDLFVGQILRIPNIDMARPAGE